MINSGDVVRVTMNMINVGGNIAQNVFHYSLTAGSGIDVQITLAALRDALDTGYTVLAPFLSSIWSYGEYDFQQSTDGGQNFFDIGSTPSLATDPSYGVNPMPSGASVVIRYGGLNTGSQGRKFIVGVGEDWVDTDTVLGGLLVAMGDFGLDTSAPVAAGGGTFTAGWVKRSDFTFVPYSGVIIANAIAGYQRRRKPGVGI